MQTGERGNHLSVRGRKTRQTNLLGAATAGGKGERENCSVVCYSTSKQGKLS